MKKKFLKQRPNLSRPQFCLFLICAIFFSCSSVKKSESVEATKSSDSEKIGIPDSQHSESIRHSERSEESQNHESQPQENFSHSTIIVSLENGTTDEEIAELAARHNLKVLYIYKNFSSCALSSSKTLADAELDSLIFEVQKEKKVLAVQKDYIMHLD